MQRISITNSSSIAPSFPLLFCLAECIFALGFSAPSIINKVKFIFLAFPILFFLKPVPFPFTKVSFLFFNGSVAWLVAVEASLKPGNSVRKGKEKKDYD